MILFANVVIIIQSSIKTLQCFIAIMCPFNLMTRLVATVTLQSFSFDEQNMCDLVILLAR